MTPARFQGGVVEAEFLWEGPWSLSADEDLDVRGDAAENPNEAVAAAGPGEDVERRPVAVEKPSTGHDLCDDVTMAPAACDDFVTAIE